MIILPRAGFVNSLKVFCFKQYNRYFQFRLSIQSRSAVGGQMLCENRLGVQLCSKLPGNSHSRGMSNNQTGLTCCFALSASERSPMAALRALRAAMSEPNQVHKCTWCRLPGRVGSCPGTKRKDPHIYWVLLYPLPGVARGLLCVHWTPPTDNLAKYFRTCLSARESRSQRRANKKAGKPASSPPAPSIMRGYFLASFCCTMLL